MAMRRVLTCEVMAGGAADGGGSTPDGTEMDAAVADKVWAAMKWAVGGARKTRAAVRPADDVALDSDDSDSDDSESDDDMYDGVLDLSPAACRLTAGARVDVMFETVAREWPADDDDGQDGTDGRLLNLFEIQQLAVAAGFTGRGEMFSARAMALLACLQTDRPYEVRLVKRDLLADRYPASRPDAYDVEPDGVTAVEYGPSWALSVVDRLMRGHLIAVW